MIPYYLYTLLRLVALCILLYHGLVMARAVMEGEDAQDSEEETTTSGGYYYWNGGYHAYQPHTHDDDNKDWMERMEVERRHKAIMWAAVIAFALVFGEILF